MKSSVGCELKFSLRNFKDWKSQRYKTRSNWNHVIVSIVSSIAGKLFNLTRWKSFENRRLVPGCSSIGKEWCLLTISLLTNTKSDVFDLIGGFSTYRKVMCLMYIKRNKTDEKDHVIVTCLVIFSFFILCCCLKNITER